MLANSDSNFKIYFLNYGNTNHCITLRKVKKKKWIHISAIQRKIVIFLTVKISKGKPHQKELGDQKGTFGHIPLDINMDPKTMGQILPLHQETALLNSTQCKEHFSLCLATVQSMRGHHNSANEKSVNFKLPVSSNGFFALNSPSQLSPVLL